MAEVSERYYLDRSALPGAPRRGRGDAARVWPPDAADRADRGRTSGARCGRSRRGDEDARAGRRRRSTRPGPDADVRRRIGELDRAGQGLTLAEKQALTRQLLKCGAPIGEINTVRKHLSAIKGGRLAARAYPAPVVTLAISDVPGDDPAVIGSGPTVADPTTLADARAVAARIG